MRLDEGAESLFRTLVQIMFVSDCCESGSLVPKGGLDLNASCNSHLMNDLCLTTRDKRI
jgi:hypothetical protein